MLFCVYEKGKGSISPDVSSIFVVLIVLHLFLFVNNMEPSALLVPIPLHWRLSDTLASHVIREDAQIAAAP